jgi:hypothetical protein
MRFSVILKTLPLTHYIILTQTAMDIDVPAGPQSSMNDVIRNIEAKYSGRTGRELGYGDDGFVDDSDVVRT